MAFFKLKISVAVCHFLFLFGFFLLLSQAALASPRMERKSVAFDCASLVRKGLGGLDDKHRGWAVIDVRDLIDPVRVLKIYEEMPNETEVSYTLLIQNLLTGQIQEGSADAIPPDFGIPGVVVGVNIPLDPMLSELITTVMARLNKKIKGREAGKLIAVEARLRRSDGSRPITPITIHRDTGYIVVNVNLLGDGTIVYFQDKETLEQGIPTLAGYAVILSGKDRAERENFLDGWKAGPHSAPDSKHPRLTLSWVVHFQDE